jgi:2-C-methyl-D-erythritol 4-phosphate cytidylyltransferase / 2-C-methyl-D-erythritol 2,4-cyclodiphosphate synthase
LLTAFASPEGSLVALGRPGGAEMTTQSAAAIHALVPCAGVGERADVGGPKQYARVGSRTVVAHTLAALARVARVTQTLVVLAPHDAQFEAAAPEFKGLVAREGGASRAASVRAGLAALKRHRARDDDWVLVHDAARCLVQPAWIDRLIDACVDDAVGGLLALPLADTLKQADAHGRVKTTVDRSAKWAAQTPQMFRLGLLEQALDVAGALVTDEASAIEALGHAPLLVPGDADNFKLTWPEDFARAERLLQPNESLSMTIRLGEGWDIHALVPGRKLILGGVHIPHDKGLAGHSDADALAHAITDALLGAAALGDIGRHFPDTDAQFKGADSMALLAEAAKRVRAAGYEIGNIDSTVIAQAPKMAPHIRAMCERLASVLGVAIDQINVKAKTAEKMGPVGEGRAIEARAIALITARAST